MRDFDLLLGRSSMVHLYKIQGTGYRAWDNPGYTVLVQERESTRGTE